MTYPSDYLPILSFPILPSPSVPARAPISKFDQHKNPKSESRHIIQNHGHRRSPHNIALHRRLLSRSKSPSLLWAYLMAVGVEASVTKYVAEVQKVVQSSGLKSHMHSYGTTIGTYPPTVSCLPFDIPRFPLFTSFVLFPFNPVCFGVSFFHSFPTGFDGCCSSRKVANSIEGPWDQGTSSSVRTLGIQIDV